MTRQAIDLLNETITVLRHELAVKASGEVRYLALLSANAVATAARELSIADRYRLVGNDEADIMAIRSGQHDGDAALFERLQRHQALQAWIADPANLDEAETASFIDEPRS